MKKLYEKSEIGFAVFWIVLYTAAMGNLRNLGDDSPWMMLGLIVISALMFLFVRKNGLTAGANTRAIIGASAIKPPIVMNSLPAQPKPRSNSEPSPNLLFRM